MTKYVIQVKKDPLRKEEAKTYPQTSPIIAINLTSMIKKQIFKIVANQYLAKSRNCLTRQFKLSYKTF